MIHGRHRRGERLAVERAEWLVFDALDVARAPVVDEDDTEDVLVRAVDVDRSRGGRAADVAELAFEVELARGRELAELTCPRGRRTGVPLTTTDDARPW